MQPQRNEPLVLHEHLPPPAIDQQLEELDALSRSTECLRFFVLSTEYWLSANGRLRQWIKLNVFLAAWLFIPAIVLMPIVSFVLHEVDGWLSVLVSIFVKLIVLSALITAAMLSIKHFPSSSKGSSRRRK